MNKPSIILYFFFFLPLLPPLLAETEKIPPGVGVDEKLSSLIPLDLPFLDEQGQSVVLGDFFQGKPVVLVPSYYSCPRLCSYVFKGVQQVVQENLDQGLRPGTDYQLISVSFDPEETVEQAHIRGESHRNSIVFENTANGLHPPMTAWPFLIGDSTTIERLFTAIGYRYKKDGAEFSHSAAIVLLTPQGHISRYLYGIQIPAQNFRLSLVEAASGGIGTTVDRVLLYCFRYNPIEGKYTPYVQAFVKIGSITTLILLVLLIVSLTFLRKK